ncbi:MAG: PadR family transcriptional regulator [Actinomycetota bacterium]|nr:PadR family transcriptional regulator [Actinomycetota bacterium]
MAPMRRRGRRDRGDVRTAVLKLLAERPMHGYEAIREISDRSSGAWKPSPGAIYPTLQLLEDEGLITPAESEGKKVFSLTDAGRAAAEELAERPAPWDDASAGLGDGEASLRQSAFGLMSAAREIGTVGTAAQQEKAVEILDEARRKLYGMLAEDPSADPGE